MKCERVAGVDPDLDTRPLEHEWSWPCHQKFVECRRCGQLRNGGFIHVIASSSLARERAESTSMRIEYVFPTRAEAEADGDAACTSPHVTVLVVQRPNGEMTPAGVPFWELVWSTVQDSPPRRQPH